MGEDREKLIRESFVFYKTFSDIIRELDEEHQLKFFWAISDYALSGEEPNFTGVLKALWIPISYQLNRSLKRYEACIKNGKKGAEFGKLGGRPRKQNPNKTPNETPDSNDRKPQTKPLNDNDNDNVNNIESNKLDSLSTLQVDSTEPKIEKNKKKSVIDFTALGNFFNATLEREGSIISRIQRITEKRRKAIEARCREYGKEAIHTVIINASKSAFLNGKNKKGWKADFDWLFLPNNFPKVLEGNYNDNSDGRNDTTPVRQSESGNTGIGIPCKGKFEPSCGLIED